MERRLPLCARSVTLKPFVKRDERLEIAVIAQLRKKPSEDFSSQHRKRSARSSCFVAPVLKEIHGQDIVVEALVAFMFSRESHNVQRSLIVANAKASGLRISCSRKWAKPPAFVQRSLIVANAKAGGFAHFLEQLLV